MGIPNTTNQPRHLHYIMRFSSEFGKFYTSPIFSQNSRDTTVDLRALFFSTEYDLAFIMLPVRVRLVAGKRSMKKLPFPFLIILGEKGKVSFSSFFPYELFIFQPFSTNQTLEKENQAFPFPFVGHQIMEKLEFSFSFYRLFPWNQKYHQLTCIRARWKVQPLYQIPTMKQTAKNPNIFQRKGLEKQVTKCFMSST